MIDGHESLSSAAYSYTQLQEPSKVVDTVAVVGAHER